MNRWRWLMRYRWRHMSPMGLAGLGALAVALVVLASGVAPAGARLQSLEQESGSLRQRLEHAGQSLADDRATPEERLAAFYGSFPKIDGVPDWLQKLYRTASAQGLTLEEGDYRLVTEKDSRLARYVISLPVQGSYPQVRKFVGAALQEMPFLALETVTFGKQKIGEAQVDAKIKFTLYVGRTP
jgi:Tfp pilus assembly protein PilO